MQLVQRNYSSEVSNYRFDLIVPIQEYEAIKAQETRLSPDKKLKEAILKYLTEHPLLQQEFLNNNLRMDIRFEDIQHSAYSDSASINQLLLLTNLPTRMVVVGDKYPQLLIYLIVTDNLKAALKILDSKAV